MPNDKSSLYQSDKRGLIIVFQQWRGKAKSWKVVEDIIFMFLLISKFLKQFVIFFCSNKPSLKAPSERFYCRKPRWGESFKREGEHFFSLGEWVIWSLTVYPISSQVMIHPKKLLYLKIITLPRTRQICL